MSKTKRNNFKYDEDEGNFNNKKKNNVPKSKEKRLRSALKTMDVDFFDEDEDIYYDRY